MTSPVLLNRMTTMGSTYGDALSRSQKRRQDDILFTRGIEDQDAIRAAMPGAVAGDPMAMEEVLRRDPGTGLKVMDFARQNQEQTRQRMRQAVMGSAASVIMAEPSARPQAYQQSRAALQRMFPGQFDDLPEQYEDRAFLGLVAPMFPPEVMEKIVAERFKPAKFGAPHAGRDASGRDVFFQTDDDGNVRKLPTVTPLSRKGMSFTVDRDGNVTYSENATESLTKPTTNDLQKDVVFGMEQLGNLDSIAREYQSDFLTYAGRFKKFTSTQMAKINPGSMSPEDRARLQKQTRFEQQVNRGFNAYRKEITGAAAAVAELDSLKKAMLNTDLSPPEFEAAYTSYRNELGRTLRLKRKLLREGIKTGEKEFGKSMDDLFSSGADDTALARGEELETEGLDDGSIAEQLRREGYIQ